jgi:hypothetical protein
MKTYRGFWKDDHTKLVFRDISASEIPSRLPPGTRVHPDRGNTIGRLDGGDEYAFALFEAGGRVLVVIPTPGEAPPGEE